MAVHCLDAHGGAARSRYAEADRVRIPTRSRDRDLSAVTWDYLIVGAGSAGCALAYELARSGHGARILVLEAGGADRSPFIKFPAAQIRAVARHDWGYRCRPDPSRNGAVEAWPRGRVLGGTSSINGTLFARGAAADFDRWANACADGRAASWSASEVMAIFRELETSDQARALRGRCGPLRVRTVQRPHAVTEAFIRSACAWYPFNEDYNDVRQEGVAYAQLSQHRGLRCSAADAFLKPMLARPGVELVLNAHVHRIELANGRAVAVSYLHRGKQHRAQARDIILCAGAIDSPKLLMLSGIGDPQELVRHGIHPLIDLPGVGRNLREHPLIKLTYRARTPTYNPTGGLLQKLRFVVQFLRTREGPVSNIFEAVAFLKSAPSEPIPDIQLHFLPAGYATMADGVTRLLPYSSFTVLLNKSYPRSTGRVRLASAHPGDAPLIECRLLEERADVDTLIRGIEVVRKIMATDPIAALIEQEVEPGPGVRSVTALEAHVRRRTGIAFHPAGTCRMGSDRDAVVGPDLRVHGTENLWIADASIMPDLISGNTNAVCVMIGAKLGKQLMAARQS